MSPIRERHIRGDISPNWVQVLCNTCWSAGRVIESIFNGYQGSPDITPEQHLGAFRKAEQHLKEKGKHHDVVIYNFRNQKEFFNDYVYRDDGLHVLKVPPLGTRLPAELQKRGRLTLKKR